MRKKFLFGAALLLMAATGVEAQTSKSNPCVWVSVTECDAVSGANPLPTTSTSAGSLPSASTVAAGVVTTHAVFQSALAASLTRKGCSIQNTSLDVEYVGAVIVASATTLNTLQVNPGDVFDCASASSLPTSTQISITSKALDGATFVVTSQ